MRNFRTTNIADYLPEGATEVYSPKVGDDFGYIPFEETEANFSYLESIKPTQDSWVITIRVENEFSGDKYTKEYTITVGSKIELNTFGDLFMCFLPPEKIPVLVEITAINEYEISLKTVGILEEYAADMDERAAKFAAANQK